LQKDNILIMKLINTEKIKNLLQSKGLKNIDLASYLQLPPSSVSTALNGKRGLSMNYIFDLAEFFEVDAKSLTIENDTKEEPIKSSAVA